jgi:hypothetical protein
LSPDKSTTFARVSQVAPGSSRTWWVIDCSAAWPRLDTHTSACARKAAFRSVNAHEFSSSSRLDSTRKLGWVRAVKTRSSSRYSRAFTSNRSRKSKSNSIRSSSSTGSSRWFSTCRLFCMPPSPTNTSRISETAPAGIAGVAGFCMNTAAE